MTVMKCDRMRLGFDWMKGILVLLAGSGIFLDSISAYSQAVKPLSFHKIIDKSGAIVHGVVSHVESGADPATGLICTWTTVEVTEWLQGDTGEKTLTFKQFGGVDKKRGVTQTSEGVILLPGEEILLCLYPPSRWGLTSPIGVYQGIFRVKRDPSRSDASLENGTPLSILFPDEETTPSDASVKAKTVQKGTDSASLLEPCKTLKLNDVKLSVSRYLSKQNRSVQTKGLRREVFGREILHGKTVSE
jgi:hypothetical protein